MKLDEIEFNPEFQEEALDPKPVPAHKVVWRSLGQNVNGVEMERIKAVCLLVAPLRKHQIYGAHNHYYISWNLTQYEFNCAQQIYKTDIPTSVLMAGHRY